MMEHEDAYLLMMEALDGELAEAGRRRLELHLHGCPGCAREWAALQAIDTLFRQTPALSPAAGFTHRTLARLPNRSHRIWLISAIYTVLLFSGTLPLVGLIWLLTLLGPALSQPTLIRSLVQSAVQLLEITGTVFGALWQGISNFGGVLGQQPAILGLLLVMFGVVWLWSGVYSQLVAPRQV